MPETILPDPVELTKALIAAESITPARGAVFDVLEAALLPLGFRVERFVEGEAPEGPVENLLAVRAGAGRHFAFAGHLDVVPPGQGWASDAFTPEIRGELLYGRGAVDMKGAIAAFVAAAARALAKGEPAGSLSLLITGDEEGAAHDGTRRVVETLQAEGETIDHCVLGEPTSAARIGDQLKIGRRGSLNAWITVEGVQGHVAYPHQAANPIPVLVRLLARLQARILDEGYPRFPASNLEVTTIDVGNPATNVIPARATARLNIRFNPAHDGEALVAWLSDECRQAEAQFAGKVTLDPRLTGNAFITEPGPFVDVCAGAVQDVTGKAPELSTTGGISDARFIRALCPVVELGLVGATMHAVDECTPVAQVEELTAIYERLIARYFAGASAASAER